MTVKLLDTNIVIYALGRDHPYREPCRAIMNQLEGHPHDYAADAEMLQEVLYVFSNRKDIETGVSAVLRLLDLFPHVIPITGSEIAVAARLIGQPPQLSIRDAIHAAVALEHGLEGIVTADKVFDHIPGVRRFDPTEVAGSG